MKNKKSLLEISHLADEQIQMVVLLFCCLLFIVLVATIASMVVFPSTPFLVFYWLNWTSFSSYKASFLLPCGLLDCHSTKDSVLYSSLNSTFEDLIPTNFRFIPSTNERCLLSSIFGNLLHNRTASSKNTVSSSWKEDHFWSLLHPKPKSLPHYLL